MPLDTFVETIDSVDENLRTFYKPVSEGEGFILDANPVKGYAVENVDNLKSALGKERTDRKDYEKKYTTLQKTVEGVDINELTGFKTKYEEIETKYNELLKIDPATEAERLADEKVRAAQDKLNSKLSSKQKEWQQLHETEINTRESRIENLTTQLRGLMIDNTATTALTEAGILPEHLELILPKVTGAILLEEDSNGKLIPAVKDKDGNPRVRADGQNMTVKDLIPELQTKWPGSFSSDYKKGTGLKPSSKTTSSKDPVTMSAYDKIKGALEAN